MTGGLLFPLMICTATLVIAALIGLAVILWPARGKSKKAPTISAAGSASKSSDKDSNIWLLYVGIAFLLGIWTLWATVFFLMVVWFMRQNPGPGTNFKVGENEKKIARRVYTWLFFSPLLTVPVFIGTLIGVYGASTDRRVLAALLPLMLHLPLLIGLTSESGFVYRHTQQGILLMALRAGLASVAASMFNATGLLLYLFGNGGLWFLGSILGWDQVNHGTCWLMQHKGEIMVREAKGGIANLAPKVHLERSREFMQRSQKEEAKSHALAAFRQGNRDVRLQALWVLEVLEEVEKF